MCWLQDTFMLPNLQTKSNDRMLVTRLQPGPFSGYGSDTIKLKECLLRCFAVKQQQRDQT